MRTKDGTRDLLERLTNFISFRDEMQLRKMFKPSTTTKSDTKSKSKSVSAGWTSSDDDEGESKGESKDSSSGVGSVTASLGDVQLSKEGDEGHTTPPSSPRASDGGDSAEAKS